MSGLKKLLGGKKKTSNDKKGKGSKESFRSSNGSIPGLNKGSSSLNLAASVESLNGYNLREKDLSKFLKASWTGDITKLKQIASKKVNWNESDKEKRTALHLASAKGFEDIVDFLVSHGANVNAKDSEGKTPLLKACESNSVKNVDILLNNGAESNVFDVNHVSPIHVAAAYGNVEIGIMLADHDSKLDTKDQNQITPLHLCCGLGNKDFVEFLISEYVGLNCLDSQKRTPLMMACIDGHMDVVKLLLDNKVDVSITDKDGHTAEELAGINDHASIAMLVSEHFKPNDDPFSPVGSIHSPKSPAELFSPVARSLNEMFPPTSSHNSAANIFGGPAINMGGPSANDKSEGSQSEPFGDNSWGDSDTDSVTEKKPKGPSLSALMKQKETEAKNSPKKNNAADTIETVETEVKAEPVNPNEVQKKKSASKIPKRSDLESNPPPVHKESEFSKSKQVTSKIPWQHEDDFSNDSESEWGDERLEEQFATGIKAGDVVNKEQQKSKESAVPLIVPPPPPDIDFSQASSDFDSSQPEETFGDLPLSGVEGMNITQEKTKKKPENLFPKKQPGNDDVADEDTNWDSTDNDDDNEILEENKVHIKKKTNQVKSSPKKKKTLSMTPDNDSDWDSDSSLPSEPSEEVLPPQTPEQGSEFEPSSSDDEDKSDFDLEKLNNKKLENPTLRPKESGHRGIFQTEVITPRGANDFSDEESNDDIEKMLGLSLTDPQNKASPIKKYQSEVSKKKPKDFDLDLGSSVSSVSDPDEIDAADNVKLDDENNNLVKEHESVKGAKVETSTALSDDESTETESEWEVEKRQKQNKVDKLDAFKNEVDKKDSVEELKDKMLRDDDVEKVKDQQRAHEYELKRKAHEDQLAAEIAEELRREMLDDGDDVNDLEFDSSSDFSYTGGGDAMSLPDNENGGDDDEAEAEAKLLEQMESKENEYHQQKEKKDNQVKQKEKEDEIKSKLQGILERAKSPQSSSKVSELLNENETDLRKRHEEVASREKEIARKEKESADRLKELEKRNEESKKNEEERLKKVQEDEERLNKLKLEQEASKEKKAISEKVMMEKKAKEHEMALKLEEERRLQRLEEEELFRRERLAEEEETRLQAILQKEKFAREEHERNEKLRREKLEKEEEEKRKAFQMEEGERRIALEKEEKDRKSALRKIEEEKKLELQKEEEERRKILQKEEVEKMNALEKEEQLRRKELTKEEENRRAALEKEENTRLRALSNEERERRKKLEDEEVQINWDLKRKEEELKRIEEQENKRNEILAQREMELKRVEEATAKKRKLFEEQLLRDQEESRSKLEMEERQRLEEINRLAEEKEFEIERRLKKMEEERMRKLEEEEGNKLKERLEEQSVLNASVDELTEERDRLFKQLQEEEVAMREKLEKELREEENRRKRKLSDEERIFREGLERDREMKLNELSNKSEEDRQELQQEFEMAQKDKERRFQEESKEKERQVLKKLEEVEQSRMKEFEEQMKLKEMETQNRLRKFDEEKRKELEEQKNEFLKRLEEEAIKNKNDYDQKEKKNRDEFQTKFHELEKESRLKEKELELQLSELRQKQRELSSGKKNAHKKVLSAIPAEEVVIAAVHVTVEEAAPVIDMLEDEGEDESNMKNEKHRERENDSSRIADFDQKLRQSQQQREIARKKIENIENRDHERSFENDVATDFSLSPPKHSSVHSFKGASTPIRGNHMLEGPVIEDLEDQLQEARRQIEIHRQRALAQERLKREMEYDIEEMHRTIDILNQSNNDKDKSNIDVDLEFRSVKYKLEQEIECKNMAERLCNQLKDQLSRSEKKLTREAESKQSVEHANRKLQTELKAREQHIHKLQSDLNELQLLLDAETQSHDIQEKLYKEQLHQHEVILQEVQRTSHDHAQTVSKLEALDETRRNAENVTDTLKMELAKAKGELSRVLSQLDEYRTQSESQIDKLRNKLDDKTEALTSAEKTLFQVQLQLENEKSRKYTNEERMTSSLENEVSAKNRLEEEITSLKIRLENSSREIDRLADTKSNTDKEMILLKEKQISENNQLLKDLNIANQQVKLTEEKLAAAEAQINTLSEQLQNTGLALAERKGEAVTVHNSMKETKDYVQQLEENFRNEKLETHKLEAKLETAATRVALLQKECEKLEKELTFTKEQFTLKDRSTSEKQEAVNSYVMTIKEDYNQEKTELLLKNEQKNLLVEKLRTELLACEGKLKDKTDQCRKVNQDLVRTQNDLSNAESEKSVLNKMKENMLGENESLKKVVSVLEGEMKSYEENKFEIEQHIHDVNSELEKSRQLTDKTTQRLVRKSSEVEEMKQANYKLQSSLRDLKAQNISMEADLREEKAEADILLQELRSANEARENLEALLSNVKGNNVTLEEKLHSEALHRSHRQREAEEHKGLWESEVKSRSKLGLKVMEMEKLIQSLKSDVDEEKRKTRRALDLKKGSDSKIDLYEQRSVQHHKEVSALKNKLKQYQRRIKEFENGESRIPSLHAEFDRERALMDANVTKLRRQLNQLSERLNHEQEMRNNSERICREQMKELTDYKTQDKVRVYEAEKLEKKCRQLEDDLERQKKHYNSNYIPQEEIEEFKRVLETQARLDLNKKLQEVNMHLEEQSLAREAFEKIRNEKESKTRQSFEETILELKHELSAVRSTLHVGLAKRDTSEVEAKRYKQLFQQEMCAKDLLSEKLDRTNERFSVERNRTNYLFDETMNKSKVSKKLFDDDLDRNRSSLSPRNTGLLDDLNLNSYRNKLWSTPAALSPHNTQERDYLSLKRRSLLS